MTLTQDDQNTEVTAHPHVTVLSDRCAGCQECSIRCPVDALSLDVDSWTVIANDELCVGCRQCVRTCPFSAITVDGPVLEGFRTQSVVHHPVKLLGDRSEIRKGIDSWEAALSEASRCLSCPDPTCIRGCPAHNDIPGFIRSIREGNLDEAHDILRRTSVMPDICSRVCDQAVQCEGSCSWSLAGGTPVAIGALERFICDNAPVPPVRVRDGHTVTKKVAIIGSGPAGASCAWELAENGAQVDVFEKDGEPGGLLNWGIPDFTLPGALPRRLWDELEKAGVTLHLNHRVDMDNLSAVTNGYDAVVVAAGAGNSIRLPVKGSDLGNIVDATHFLTQSRLALSGMAGESPISIGAGDRVLVVGAGNTAMDSARMAIRLGAKPICVDWMNEKFAPVRRDELEEARQEGVEVRFGTTVDHFEGENGKVTKAVLLSTSQESAAKLPVTIKSSAHEIEVDLVIMAMGYRIPSDITDRFPQVPIKKTTPELVDRRWRASGLFAEQTVEWARNLNVGSIALSRDIARNLAGVSFDDKIWVIGDSMIGPATVVEAMAHGKHAARAILEHSSSQKVANVLVVFDSQGGKTAEVAKRVESYLSDNTYKTRITPIGDVSTGDLAWCDAIVLATWIEGLVIAGVQVSKRTRKWIETLPNLGHRPVVLVATYGVSPKNALEKCSKLLSAKGGDVKVAGGVRTSTRNVDTYLVSSKVKSALDKINQL